MAEYKTHLERKKYFSHSVLFEPAIVANTILTAVLNQDIKALEKALQSPNETLLNQQNEYGQTALHIAVMQGNLLSIQALLSAGADWNILDHYQRTPLDWSKQFLKAFSFNSNQYFSQLRKHVLAYLQTHISHKHWRKILSAEKILKKNKDIMAGSKQLLSLTQAFVEMAADCRFSKNTTDTQKYLLPTLLEIEKFKKLLRLEISLAISKGAIKFLDQYGTELNALFEKVDYLLGNFFELYNDLTGVIASPKDKDKKSESKLLKDAVYEACQKPIIKIDETATLEQITLLFEKIKDKLDQIIVVTHSGVSDNIKKHLEKCGINFQIDIHQAKKDIINRLPFDHQQHIMDFLNPAEGIKLSQAGKVFTSENYSVFESSSDSKIVSQNTFLGFAPETRLKLKAEISEKKLDGFQIWFLEQDLIQQKILMGKWSLTEAIQNANGLNWRQKMAMQRFGAFWEEVSKRDITAHHLALLSANECNPVYRLGNHFGSVIPMPNDTIAEKILELSAEKAELLSRMGSLRFLFEPVWSAVSQLSDAHIRAAIYWVSLNNQNLWKLHPFLNYIRVLSEASAAGLLWTFPSSSSTREAISKVSPEGWKFTFAHRDALKKGISYHAIRGLSEVQVQIMLLFDPPLSRSFIECYLDLNKFHFELLKKQKNKLEKKEAKTGDDHDFKAIERVLRLKSFEVWALNAGLQLSQITDQLSIYHIQVVEDRKASVDQVLHLTAIQAKAMLSGLAFEEVFDTTWITPLHLIAFEKGIPFKIIKKLSMTEIKLFLKLNDIQVQGIRLGFSFEQVCSDKFDKIHIFAVHKQLFAISDIADLNSTQIQALLNGAYFDQVRQANERELALLSEGVPYGYLQHAIKNEEISNFNHIYSKAQKKLGFFVVTLALQLGFSIKHIASEKFSSLHNDVMLYYNATPEQVMSFSTYYIKRLVQELAVSMTRIDPLHRQSLPSPLQHIILEHYPTITLQDIYSVWFTPIHLEAMLRGIELSLIKEKNAENILSTYLGGVLKYISTPSAIVALPKIPNIVTVEAVKKYIHQCEEAGVVKDLANIQLEEGSDLSHIIFNNCCFDGAILKKVKFGNVKNCSFIATDLTESQWGKLSSKLNVSSKATDIKEDKQIIISLKKISFYGAILSGSTFSKVKFSEVNFIKSDLESSSFIQVKGDRINFTYSHLKNAMFLQCPELRRINVYNTCLTRINLKKAEFSQHTFLEIPDEKNFFHDLLAKKPDTFTGNAGEWLLENWKEYSEVFAKNLSIVKKLRIWTFFKKCTILSKKNHENLSQTFSREYKKEFGNQSIIIEARQFLEQIFNDCLKYDTNGKVVENNGRLDLFELRPDIKPYARSFKLFHEKLMKSVCEVTTPHFQNSDEADLSSTLECVELETDRRPREVTQFFQTNSDISSTSISSIAEINQIVGSDASPGTSTNVTSNSEASLFSRSS